MRRHRLGCLFGLLLVAALAVPAPPGLWAGSIDWPQWRGVRRDGISAQTGLLKDWPKQGPPLAWKATGLGAGYSAVSVAGGRDGPGRYSLVRGKTSPNP